MRFRVAIAMLPAVVLVWAVGGPGSVARAQQAEETPQQVPQDAWGASLEPVDLEELAAERRLTLMQNAPGYRVKRYLEAAGEELDEGNSAEAKRLLERLDMSRLNPVERANVYRILAYVNYQLGELEAALEAFEKTLGEGGLRIKDDVSIMFNVVQLRAALEDWDGVLDALDRWRRHVPAPTPIAYYLRAVAFYQLERFDEALVAAENAVEIADQPKEPWLQMLAALYVIKEDYVSVTPVLEELVMRFPKKTYWVQLSLIYGAREDYRHSLAVQQIAYMQGFLDEDRELQRLARSYVFAGLPYEAAQVLEKGLEEGRIEEDPEAYEFLANSWIQARDFDRSMEPLRTAAELSDDGDLYVRLGQVHMAREQWQEAVGLFEKAIDKGGLTKPGTAELLLGIAFYNTNRVGSARFAFTRAREYEPTRKAADDWLRHIENESQSS